MIITLIINALSIFLAANLLPGVHLTDLKSAFIVAIVLGIVNTVIKPILVILTLPITIVTLGLFTLIINAFLILIVSNFVPGFKIDGFWWAFIFSLLLSFINSLLDRFVG